MEALEQVVSADGTSIAIWRSGSGPPLVLVHGTAADHGRWAPVLPALEARFTVLAIDRRGRGGSGDADDYALQREYEDVVAAVEAAVAETKRVARRKMKRAVKRSFERGYDSGNEAATRRATLWLLRRQRRRPAAGHRRGIRRAGLLRRQRRRSARLLVVVGRTEGPGPAGRSER